ncbi:VIT family-domain-containing protein [Podospora didyma]|uniref:VIT family-domain-containing protein n=1 Tax=Podospora didyma TaxID=330526 RepID=A0AAE0NHF1_9PEZI|nr:VIT family-domain-containing protein [Podospora didyma]
MLLCQRRRPSPSPSSPLPGSGGGGANTPPPPDLHANLDDGQSSSTTTNDEIKPVIIDFGVVELQDYHHHHHPHQRDYHSSNTTAAAAVKQQPPPPTTTKPNNKKPQENDGRPGGGGGVGLGSGLSFKVNARVVSDATIGLSDGLTVPFALTAGLSALGDTKVVIFGGLAELIAGAISMGLGGYLGAKSEAASYTTTLAQTTSLLSCPQSAHAEVLAILTPFNLPPPLLASLATHLLTSPSCPRASLTDLVMRLRSDNTGGGGGGAPPPASRALASALTIAAAYFLGGLVPLLPYLCVHPGPEGNLQAALWMSVGVMGVALFVFGYVKTGLVSGGWRGAKQLKGAVVGGVQMVVVGGAAAAAAMGLVKGFDRLLPSSGE